VAEQTKTTRFEQAVLPHLDSAYNLARWLVRNEDDAEDLVQEAYLRAFKFFDGFHGGNSRAWLLTIVRHTCYSWLHQHRAPDLLTVFDEELHSGGCDTYNPERLLLQQIDQQTLRAAVAALPVGYREVVILRDLEGLAYKEIAAVAGIPLGTVMSRLARAHQRLQIDLTARLHKEDRP
jgi:RNA polymerase sigma-70 factor (ECF subfamily)